MTPPTCEVFLIISAFYNTQKGTTFQDDYFLISEIVQAVKLSRDQNFLRNQQENKTNVRNNI